MGMLDTEVSAAIQAFLVKARRAMPIERAFIYGSRARGDARPDSDVDVAVILPGIRGDLIETQRTLSNTAFDVLLETGQLVSPTPIWEEDWEHPEHYTNPRFIKNVRRDGIPV
ncbi:nucleotidyltransferase family protein [Acidithiobacillus sp. M4-SHS-6]|uniref:nucleotidyltransferase family protein n=1 Tax=Acidithiobacillus sp. M4-SHS-6 TaxID=3383024 RepID=UPI0039BE87F7